VELNTGQKRAGPESSKASHRASLACVACRAKHVKCDNTLPLCVRCKDEGKPCHYIKTRRGVRGRKKRSTMKEEVLNTDKDDMTDSAPSLNLAGPSTSFAPTMHPAISSGINPFDLYYANFHVAHSWLPPRKTLDHLYETQPDDLRFLVATVTYIGSLYLGMDDYSTPLREKAYNMSQDILPLTIWSVQGLLCLSIAAIGKQHFDIGKSMFSRACKLALDLGLQDKAFADRQTDPMLAESCRRTYWGLYIHEMLLGLRQNQLCSVLYFPESILGMELPCKDWDYQAGVRDLLIITTSG
ncbi:hypothetical protein IL306_002937, partial [Fusarium sp. DS 682]